MNEDRHRGHHDLGGLPAGPVEADEHTPEPWEKRVDALVKVLADDRRRLLRTDEMRRAIESLEPDVYARLGYYERWISAVTMLMVEKGVLEQAEIEARVADLAAREASG
jgi:hypothetical protein